MRPLACMLLCLIALGCAEDRVGCSGVESVAVFYDDLLGDTPLVSVLLDARWTPAERVAIEERLATTLLAARRGDTDGDGVSDTDRPEALDVYLNPYGACGDVYTLDFAACTSPSRAASLPNIWRLDPSVSDEAARAQLHCLLDGAPPPCGTQRDVRGVGAVTLFVSTHDLDDQPPEIDSYLDTLARSPYPRDLVIVAGAPMGTGPDTSVAEARAVLGAGVSRSPRTGRPIPGCDAGDLSAARPDLLLWALDPRAQAPGTRTRPVVLASICDASWMPALSRTIERGNWGYGLVPSHDVAVDENGLARCDVVLDVCGGLYPDCASLPFEATRIATLPEGCERCSVPQSLVPGDGGGWVWDRGMIYFTSLRYRHWLIPSATCRSELGSLPVCGVFSE